MGSVPIYSFILPADNAAFQETTMPKGQQRSNREKKKPKQPKPVAPVAPRTAPQPWKK